MKITTWLREPDRRAQLPARVLLVVAIVWGLFRTAWVVFFHTYRNATPTHDLYTYYSIWFVLQHRDCADIALRGSLYLPHAWFFFTPLFILGWPTARVLMFLINVGAVFYIWWRLSELAGLGGIRRWLLLAFFLGWSATGCVIGLGNLALICLAAALAAYPFTSRTSSIFLTLSAMKQSLVFPLYFQLLLKRPRSLIVPFGVFALCGLAVLWWTRLGVTEGLGVLKDWVANVSTWTRFDSTNLRRLFGLFIKDKLALSVVVWVIWGTLFAITARCVKDPLAQLAALFLLCLLPMYHYGYDLVVAVPALAVFLQRCQLVWPTLMTFALSSNWVGALGRIMPAGPWRVVYEAYCPFLVLLFLGGLLYLEINSSKKANPIHRQA